MGTFAPITDNEAGNLLGYLDLQRDTFRYVAHGLSDEQARLQPTAGTLSIGGLIKHVAQVERGWVATSLSQPLPDETQYVDAFTLRDDETLAGALADLEACGRETTAALGELSMDHSVPVPDAPWFPKDIDAWPLRWVLGHLIAELARHAGHADLIREAIDGKTMYELQAMADGWHEEFLKMQEEYA